MSCEVGIHIEHLIQLVRERDCIWDISSEKYKDKNLRKEAWREICEDLITDFNELDKKERTEICKSIQLKWKNVRERYLKLLKVEKNAPSSSGLICKKPYVYSKHLNFLKPLGLTAQTTSSLENDGDCQEDSSTSALHTTNTSAAQKRKTSQTSTFEQELLQKLDTPEEQSMHMVFMKGIESSLQTLTADEVLEWQHNALEALLAIKKNMSEGLNKNLSDVEISINFVQLVQQYECIYNHKCKEYSRKDIVDKAWEEISAQMQWSVIDCRDKWKNIRNGFVRNRKNLQFAKNSSGKVAKTYYLSSYLEFLVPYIRPVSYSKETEVFSDSIDNDNLPALLQPSITIKEENVEEFSDLIPEVYEDQNFRNKSRKLENGSKFTNLPPFYDIPNLVINEEVSEELPENPLKLEPNLARKKTKNNDKGMSEADKAFCKYLEERSGNNEDPDRMFLLSLLKDMKRLSDPNLRQFKIQTMSQLSWLVDES